MQTTLSSNSMFYVSLLPSLGRYGADITEYPYAVLHCQKNWIDIEVGRIVSIGNRNGAALSHLEELNVSISCCKGFKYNGPVPEVEMCDCDLRPQPPLFHFAASFHIHDAQTFQINAPKSCPWVISFLTLISANIPTGSVLPPSTSETFLFSLSSARPSGLLI